jgi:transcriptional regulator with XRE-family HTH domain
MKNQLKKFRVEAGKTQEEVAQAVGVTQPNYYRWESGRAPIPEGQLNKLAKVFNTTPDHLLGKHPPIEAAFYDESAPDELQYYGEVTAHFLGGGEPLPLSISEDAYSRLYRDLQRNLKLVAVQSLSNQTVIIRSKAISDLYFSSEAYDDFGPHEYREIHLKQYKRSLQLPDPRDWDIIESLCHDVGIEGFDKTDIQRIEKILEPTTDEEFEQLVLEGKIKAEDVEAAKATEAARLEQIYELATTIVCQLSTGQTRKITEAESEAIYAGFWEYLLEFEDFKDQMICLPAEGYHRSVFINTDGFDYISIPTHKWEEGRIEANAESIDAFPPEADKPKKRRRSKVVESS